MGQHIQSNPIELANEGGAVPQEIHLFPLGRSVLLDNRVFEVKDAQAIIDRSMGQRPNDLPIDYEHQNDSKEAMARGPIPAAGWITSMVAKADGIWGKVEWTARARQMIANREYRYVSPSFKANSETGEVHMIKGAALVHTPALTLTALARADDETPFETVTARFASALGLDATATESEVLDAITARATPDPAKFVPIEVLQDYQTQTAAMREQEVADKVNAAITGAYITPAMRDWATELCRSDPASFDTFITSQPPAFGYLLQSPFDKMDERVTTARASDVETDISRQLGIDPSRLRD